MLLQTCPLRYSMYTMPQDTNNTPRKEMSAHFRREEYEMVLVGFIMGSWWWCLLLSRLLSGPAAVAKEYPTP